MRKMILGLCLLSCSAIHAEQLTNFEQIRSSILEGQNIKLVIDFSACTPNINDLVIYTAPHDIALHKDYLEFADVPYITDASLETGANVDFENVTYRLTNTDELHFQFKSIMMNGRHVAVHESSAVCSLTTAVRVFN